MNVRITAGILALFPLSYAQAASAEAPLLTVSLAPGPMDEATNSGWVDIALRLPNADFAAGQTLFTTPAGDEIVVMDSQGAVPRAEGRGFIAGRRVTGTLDVRYRVQVRNTADNGGTTPIRPRLDGRGFSAIGMSLLTVPQTDKPYRIRIAWDLSAMAPGAEAVSSFGDGDVDTTAGPVARLSRTVFMAGHLQREPPSSGAGRFAAVWSGDPGFDLRPPMRWTERLHAWMVEFFQTHDDPAYRVFIRQNGGRNPGGGVAFPNSFFATWGPGVSGESMNQILGHEMVHTFTAHGLGKWYDEGSAVYYQVQLPWRAGMVSTEAYLRDINLTAARYYTNAEIGSDEARIEPNFFSNLWLNTLGYDRGALYFAILNGKIRRASDGRRSIDDLVRTMVRRHRDGETVKETTWLELLREAVGDEAITLHRSMLAGAVIVPESDDYGPCFRRYSTKLRRYELGFTAKPSPDRRSTVTDLIAGSEAEKAGLRNGDRVTLPVITTEGVRRDWARTVTMPVTRGDQTFEVTYLPRGAAYDAWQWERTSNVEDSACRP